MSENRALVARRARADAADLAFHREHAVHKSNGDEQRFAPAHYPMNFTKGLDHDPVTGLVNVPQHFESFRNAIDTGMIEAFTTRVPVPTESPRRQWEAPTAGVTFDLQGPDAQSVTMPPAPALCSAELAYEMAEVYELALLRDTPFHVFDQAGGPGSSALNISLDRLNAMDYTAAKFNGRPRKHEAGLVTRQTAFRGSAPDVEKGPYLSQFLLMGTALPGEGNTTDAHIRRGHIGYGAQCVPQKVVTAPSGQDYMQDWDTWLHVQQGYQPLEQNTLAPAKRFLNTPRDLATYVHFDALYQAYLNAALILLATKAPFDRGFDLLSGMRPIFDMHHGPTGLAMNTGGFALYGGPHILTMVTEVATRALKAVRYQKFNNHLRLRPEALAARVHVADAIDTAHPNTHGAFGKLRTQIGDTVAAVEAFNPSGTALLPMAFAEGSPMHPSYGAGHATVAGACVTVLKAFFDTGARLGKNAGRGDASLAGACGFFTDLTEDAGFYYESVDHGENLARRDIDCALTLEGELNKLAANISIGRNMAGVHFFSDYYDSLRMGEQIAIGMLEEQALCYQTDPFVMSVPTFDGDVVRIGRR